MSKISPKYDQSYLNPPVSIEKFINVYDDRVNGWFFQPVKILLRCNHTDFAILHILSSYFESYAMYATGTTSEHKSECFFIIGFLSVFSRYLPPIEAEPIAKIFYDDLRCGLAHDSLPRSKIVMMTTIKPFYYDADGSKESIALRAPYPISGNLFFNAIQEHSAVYVTQLRNPDNNAMRDNFEKMFRKLFLNKKT